MPDASEMAATAAKSVLLRMFIDFVPFVVVFNLESLLAASFLFWIWDRSRRCDVYSITAYFLIKHEPFLNVQFSTFQAGYINISDTGAQLLPVEPPHGRYWRLSMN
jgi:hypothetical protein